MYRCIHRHHLGNQNLCSCVRCCSRSLQWNSRRVCDIHVFTQRFSTYIYKGELMCHNFLCYSGVYTLMVHSTTKILMLVESGDMLYQENFCKCNYTLIMKCTICIRWPLIYASFLWIIVNYLESLYCC